MTVANFKSDIIELILGLISVFAFFAVLYGIAVFLSKLPVISRMYFIQKVCDSAPKKAGDICFINGWFLVKSYWRTFKLSYSDISIIETYKEIDAGCEEHYCVDVIFKSRQKLLFCATNMDHIKLLDNVLSGYFNIHVDWEWSSGIYNSEKKSLYNSTILSL